MSSCARLAANVAPVSAHHESARTLEELGLRFKLIDMYATGKLNSTDVANIAWKAKRVGAGGVQDLAVDPTIKGGNKARAIRRALALDVVKDIYQTQIPQRDVYRGSRCEPPHEAIARDFHIHTAEYLAARADEDNLNVPSFLPHELVQRRSI